MKRVLILVLALSVLSTSILRAQDDSEGRTIQYSASLGMGTSVPFNPNEFNDGWNPGLGFMVDVGAAINMIEASLNLDYSFFISQAIEPNDVNVLTTFLQLKIKPLNTTARPYVFVGAGLFRFWIVDLDIYENVLGFGGGAGVEIEIDDTRRVFVEGKAVQGRTRLGDQGGDIPNFRKANTEIIPIRAGITFTF